MAEEHQPIIDPQKVGLLLSPKGLLALIITVAIIVGAFYGLLATLDKRYMRTDVLELRLKEVLDATQRIEKNITELKAERHAPGD